MTTQSHTRDPRRACSAKAHVDALKINEAKKLDPASNCEYALHAPSAEREAMTHEIVRDVHILTQRLVKHIANNNLARAARVKNDVEVLDAVLKGLPPDLFDALVLGCTQAQIVAHGLHSEQVLYLLRDKLGPTWGLTSCGGVVFASSANVCDAGFALEEVIGGIIAALAERIEHKHENGRKLARVNRRLRGILAILDNS